ncbi:MAG: hypothetical protein K6A62_04570 [Bacteroidales bacterium]|nr:hypothetical protein [Bacteroidales bacterium]
MTRKHSKLITVLCALVFLAGVVASVVAPWWAVWFIIFPLMYVAGIAAININTDWLWKY